MLRTYDSEHFQRIATAGFGSLNERVLSSTGLSYDSFLQRMKDRALTRRLILEEHPRGCVHQCKHCYMVSENVPIRQDLSTSGSIKDILRTNDFDYAGYEPQDVFMDPEFLSVISATGQPSIEVSPLLVARKPQLLELASQLPNLEAIVCSLHGDQSGHCRLMGLSSRDFTEYLRGLRIIAESSLLLEIQTAVCSFNYKSISTVAEIVRDFGVKEWRINRILPVGRAAKWEIEEFIYGEGAIEAVDTILESITLLPQDVFVWLESTWGINFYNARTFKILSGEIPSESVSRYFCDATDPRNSLHVSLMSKKVYPCPFLISFPEMATGEIVDNRIYLSGKQVWDPKDLHSKLRGICSDSMCQYHTLCAGGCRSTAFSFAKKRRESNPIYAGMDFCISRYIDEYSA